MTKPAVLQRSPLGCATAAAVAIAATAAAAVLKKLHLLQLLWLPLLLLLSLQALLAGVLIRRGWQSCNHCWCPGAAVPEMVMLPLSLLSCTCLAMSVAVAATSTMLLLHSQCTSPEVRAAATAAVDPWFAPLSLAGRRWWLQLFSCWQCCCAGTSVVLVLLLLATVVLPLSRYAAATRPV